MNKVIKQYFLKTINYKLLNHYKNFFLNDNRVLLNYFYWFNSVEYKHSLEGLYFKKKKAFSVNTFFLISFFKTIKVYQIFFINSPFLFFIKKIKNKSKSLKKIFFFKGKK